MKMSGAMPHLSWVPVREVNGARLPAIDHVVGQNAVDSVGEVLTMSRYNPAEASTPLSICGSR